MRRIAIITDGWRRYSNYAWIDGCRRYAKETHMDVEFYVFHSFGNFSKDAKFNLGEYSIWELVNFNDFDAVIFEITNISEGEIRQQLIARAKEAKIPVLSLVEEIDGLYFAGVDNYNALRKLAVHLIEKHGCKKLFYIGGPIQNDENTKRFQAYKDCLKEYGLPYEEHFSYHKNYEIETGEEAFRYYLEKKELPEAFVCANDNIAVGICHEARKHGYEVPRDFLVTGFDNFDKASIYSPTITTVGVTREQIAAGAMEFIREIWDGNDKQSQKFTPVKCAFQESCGCILHQNVDRRDFVMKHIFDEVNENYLQNAMLEFKRRLVECDSFAEMQNGFKACLPVLQCEDVYVFLNKKMLDLSIELDQNLIDLELESVEEDFRNQEMDVLLGYEKGEIIDVTSQKVKIDDKYCPFRMSERATGDIFLYLPLHFRDVKVGYMVFKNADHILEQQLIFEMLTTFQETLENVYSKMMLRKLNRKLAGLYMKDFLTGTYNRTAYEPIMEACFEKYKLQKKPVVIMFSDVNGLKHINDTYGHDMGDVAIMAVARALRECCKDDIVMRYGGDEFVILCPQASGQDAENRIKRLESYLATSSLNQGTEFEITTSIGYVTVEDYTHSLEDYIHLADERMYKKKKANKMSRDDNRIVRL